MKKIQTVALTLFTVLVLGILFTGCEGNDDDKDNEHDSKLGSLSTIVTELTGAGSTHAEDGDIHFPNCALDYRWDPTANACLDTNGCTASQAWTPPVVADPNATPPILGVPGFCAAPTP